MKTFKDLEFKRHDLSRLEGECTKHARMFFPNGYGVLVLFGKKFYSNGFDTYELAVIRKCDDGYSMAYDTPITNDVLAHLTGDEVTEIMIEVQRL